MCLRNRSPMVFVAILLAFSSIPCWANEPRLQVSGQKITLESVVDYRNGEAATNHLLSIGVPPPSGGQMRLLLQGDFGSSYESASLSVEGVLLGTLEQTGPDCLTQEAVYELDGSTLATFAADGQVLAFVQNSNNVGGSCPLNLHTVRLEYRLSADLLDFGTLFVGQEEVRLLSLRNTGSADLSMTSIASGLAQLYIRPSEITVSPGAEYSVEIRFLSTHAGTVEGHVDVVSNDPEAPLVRVPVVATVIEPPVVVVEPRRIDAQLFTGGLATHPLWISNAGAHDLNWDLEAWIGTFFETVDASPVFPPSGLADPDKEDGTLPQASTEAQRYSFAEPDLESVVVVFPPPSLYSVKLALKDGFRELTDRIPESHLFSDGETGINIFDGGDDMYDVGNYIRLDGRTLEYTRGRTVTHLPTGSRYFTEKYPGLFVAAIDIGNVHAFQIKGNLGADGFGSVDGLVLDARGNVPYRGFVKRVYGADSPSVNHMILIPQIDAAGHVFSTDSNDDFHEVFNLGGHRRIYYLLYSGKEGAFIDDEATREIMEAFIELVEPGWLRISPASGVLPPGGSQEIAIMLDAFRRGLALRADLQLTSNDPIRPLQYIPVLVNVTPAPDIRIAGGTVVVESERRFADSHQVTELVLPIVIAPAGRGLLEVFSDGDFDEGDSMVSVEGMVLGPTGTARSCQQATTSFDLPEDTLDLLVADGRVVVSIANGRAYAWSCDVSQHRVRLSYPGPTDEIRLGPLFPGQVGTGSIVVESFGYGTLEVDVATDNPEFLSSPESISIPHGGPVPVVVSLQAQEPGFVHGSLLLATNDPDEPSLSIPMVAEVVPPPQVVVSPAALRAFLPMGDAIGLPFTVTNDGESELEYSLEVSGPGGQGQGFMRVRGDGGSRIEVRITYDEATSPLRISGDGTGPTDGVESLTTVFFDPEGVPVRTAHSVTDGISTFGQLRIAYDVQGVSFRSAIFIGEYESSSDYAWYFQSAGGGFYMHRSGAVAERAKQITYQAWPPFIELSRREGRLQPDGSDDAVVFLDAAEYFPGEFMVDIDIHSNDPSRPSISIPVTVTLFDNEPPEAVVQVSDTVECTSPSGALVILDGSASADPNTYPAEYDDILAYHWFEGFGGQNEVFLGNGAVLEAVLSLGVHEVTLRVTDRSGAVDIASGVVAVVDGTPPVLSVGVEPRELWPPNHRMVSVVASVSAHDLCSEPAVVLEFVDSSEEDDAPGNGDGRTRDDVREAETGVFDESFLLRAERAAGGAGRSYVATYRATDAHGNWSTASAVVAVPHDQGDGNVEPLLLSAEQAVSGTRIQWGAVPDATSYTVVRGNLTNLLDDGEVHRLGAVICIAAQIETLNTEGLEDPERPELGMGFFYLAEYGGDLPSGLGATGASRERLAEAGCE